jgi:hypothetical protein
VDPIRTREGNEPANAPPAGQPPAPQGGIPARTCPNCRKPLWVVVGSRWCSNCGYREVTNEAPEPVPGAVAPGRKGSRPRRGEWSEIQSLIPRWGWALLGGMAVVGLASVAAGLKLPPNSLPRAVWTTVQVGVGVISLLLAQVSVCGLLGLQREGIGLLDLLFPDKIWRMAFRRLPETRWQVCWGAWSLALVGFALLFINGLTYWLPKKGALKAKVHVAKVFNIKKSQLKPDEDDAETAPEKQDDAPKPETTRCVVVGYTVERGQLAGLVLARAEGDELRYAGIIRPGLSTEQKEKLLKKFGPLQTSEPLFPNFETPAVWLKPKLDCEVEHAGFGDDKLLKEPHFKGLVEDEPGDPDAPADGLPQADPPAPSSQVPARVRPDPKAPRAPKPGRAAPGSSSGRP